MAYPYGTGSGVTFMKKTAKTDKHFFIKGAMVLFLVIYLGTLYNSDNARNVPVEQIAQVLEQDQNITSLNQEGRTDLKHYYQTDDRDLDGYFFLQSSLSYGCRRNLHHEGPESRSG